MIHLKTETIDVNGTRLPITMDMSGNYPHLPPPYNQDPQNSEKITQYRNHASLFSIVYLSAREHGMNFHGAIEIALRAFEAADQPLPPLERQAYLKGAKAFYQSASADTSDPNKLKVLASAAEHFLRAYSASQQQKVEQAPRIQDIFQGIAVLMQETARGKIR